MDFLRPDAPSKCLYHKNKNAPNPHGKLTKKPLQKISPNILHTVGDTPLVKLNRLPQSIGIECDVLAKCEFLNPGGSIKDRIAIAMLEDAEKRGVLKPDSVIIEPTSGNGGIGIAMACAVKGYKCVCVIPEKTSREKEDILKCLGAEIVRSPGLTIDDPKDIFRVTHTLVNTIPNAVDIFQFHNPYNPLAHYFGTGTEILEQCDGQVDMVVMGVGTGGTLTGIGRKIKEACPNCLIVGVDPMGSEIAQPPSLNITDESHFEMEGVGLNFVPSTLDTSIVDFWVKVHDKSAFKMARRLNKEEGILCGSSSGCLMKGAMIAARKLKKGQKCVVLLPDGARNYLTKFVSDYWMESNNFIPICNKFNHWWWDSKVSELTLKPCTTVRSTMTCEETSKILNTKNLDLVPCINKDRTCEGIVHGKDLIVKLLNSTITLKDSVKKVVSDKYRTVKLTSCLGELSHILERESFAVVVEEHKQKQSNSSTLRFKGLLFSADLIHYINMDNNNVE